MKMPSSVEVGVLKKFVDTYTPCTESPRSFLWSSFAGVFGLAISPYVRRAGEMQTEPRFYLCNIGPSGTPRKSTGSKLAMKCFERALKNDYVRMEKGFGSSEGLLSTLQTANGVPVLTYLDELELMFKKVSVNGSAGITPLHPFTTTLPIVTP
jgi:hypothetical protein